VFAVGRQWLLLWLLLLPSMAESAGSRILVQANFISHVRRSQKNVWKVKIKIIVAGLYQAALQLPAACRPLTLTSHLLHPALLPITCVQMQIGTSRADSFEHSLVLEYCASSLGSAHPTFRKVWSLCSFETSGFNYVRAQCRTVEHVNLHDPMSLRCLVDLRSHLPKHLEVETALTSSVAQSARK
jgi:hypothetical protein